MYFKKNLFLCTVCLFFICCFNVESIEPIDESYQPNEDIFDSSHVNAQTSINSRLLPEEDRIIKIFNHVSSSVVFIKNATLAFDWFSHSVYEIPQGVGSGFVWDKEGHIVTNFHVIANSRKVEAVLYNKKSYVVEIVGIAPEYDLAVLKIDTSEDMLHPIIPGISKNLQVGQKILAIGNPFGLDYSLSVGVISALGRTMPSFLRRKIYDVIQTDVAINPGNSGGPLLNSSGELIGVSAAIYSPNGVYAGVSFGIPVDTVKRIVPQLIKYGKTKKIGIGITLLHDSMRQRLGITGVLILNILNNGAGDKAGLLGTTRDYFGEIVYGDIITAINDEDIRNNDDLIQALENKKTGEKIHIRFFRQQKEMSTTVILEELE